MNPNNLILEAIMQLDSPKKRRIKKDYDISKNVNKEICTKCGGECCKICGCHFSPDDFKKITFESLKEEINKGYISIEYVDREHIYSNHGCYILRIRNENSPIVEINRTHRKACMMLTEHGCKFDYKHRPTGGKLLIPSKEGRCKNKYSIRDCCYEWEQYQNILCDLVDYFKESK